MERYLVIAIDEGCNIYKTLMKDDSLKIDEFTSQFEDTYELRNHFKNEIEVFYNENKQVISDIEKRNNRKETGDIVVNEVTEEGRTRRVSVLYKKQMVVTKEVIKNRKFMDRMVNYSKIMQGRGNKIKLFSDFLCNVIKWDLTYNENTFLRHISKWYSGLKKDSNRYDIIRILYRKYDDKYKELGLKSADIIYKEYTMNKNLNKKSTKKLIENNIEEPIIDEIDLDREFIPDIDEAYKYNKEKNLKIENPHEREKILYKPYKYDESLKKQEENDMEQLKLT